MSASTHSIKHIALTAICAAVLAACGGGGSGGASNSLNTNVVENATAARSVMDDIEALPEAEELTAEQLSAVAAAQQRYNNLSDSQKLMVAQTSTDKLQALLEAAESAAASAVSVSQEIASLPASSKLTAADDDEISQARTSYDALTDNEKSWVSDESLAKLVAAEQTAAANKTAAEAWTATAQALTAASSLSKSDEAGVNAVQAAYNNLTAAQQSYLAAADTVELQSRLAAVAENKQLAADFAAAVAALPTASSLNESNDDSVGNVRDAYEALSTSEKTWVSEASLTQLSLAEQTIADNKTAAATWAATAQALTAASSLSKSDEAGVNAVQAAYNNLTAAQQSYLAAADTAELQSRLAAVAENKQLAADFTAAVAALPQNGLDIDTAEEEKALAAVNEEYSALTDSQKTWLSASVVSSLDAINSQAILDNDSLSAVNAALPRANSFLSEEINDTAQQFNPHRQLRSNGRLLDNQTALIKTISINAPLTDQDTISIQGIAFEEDGNDVGKSAGTVEYIAKINSQETIIDNDARRSSVAQDTAQEVVYRQDADKTVLDKKWDGIYALRTTGGVVIILRDPAAIGWNYQTFAHYADLSNGVTHAYQSIGIETAVADVPVSGTATYSGLSTAYLVDNGTSKQLSSDVTAVADFAKKGLRFATSNTQVHTLSNGLRVSESADAYDLKGSATWSANQNIFNGTVTAANGMSGDLNGKFYGETAAEIGGTYGLSNAANTQQLIGGYGAKRK